jgi:hypothetical protein
MKFIAHMYIVVQVSEKRWQVAESWNIGGEVTYKGSVSKHFRVVGQRFCSWEHAHEYAGQLEAAQRQAIEMTAAKLAEPKERT